MRMLRACGVAAVIALGLAPQTQAVAQYYYGPHYYGPPGYGPYGRAFGFRPYAFRPYGFYRPYGFRRFNPRLSYGTGYHGRGSWTGGPSGGLPSRN